MKILKALAVSCLLVMALAITGSAQTAISQIPTPCVNGTIYAYTPQGGAYTSQPAGLYTCIGNVFMSYGGAGATTQALIGSSFTNATATAATIFTFPVLANTNYRFSCSFFYQNSGTNAVTFTMTTPASPTNVIAEAQNIYTVTGTQTFAALTGSPLAIATTAVATGTNFLERIEGTIENGSTAGNLNFQGSSATGTTAVARGSFWTVNALP